MPSSATLKAPSGLTATVSIIDTTSRITGMSSTYLMGPKLEKFDEMSSIPSWSFLVQNQAGKKVLFDMGIPHDWRNASAYIQKHLAEKGWKIDHDKTVATILEDNGVSRSEISSMIWSHFHWDHLGNPEEFPAATELVVGPGFKEKNPAGWPTVQDSLIRDSDITGREVREISFDGGLEIGPFRAHDFFGDGSFYLLDTPGHEVGHLGALARTTSEPDTFIFMGGDLCHHAGELRPSPHLPFPADITPHPWDVRLPSMSCCLLEKPQVSRGRKFPNQSFFDVTAARDLPTAQDTIKRSQELDGDPTVFFIFAHDSSIIGHVDLFPATANNWKNKGWKDAVYWGFLGDMKEGLLAFEK